MTKKILIIGAGMAGLSAGIHARRNGYDVEIYEQHNLPGGLCTAWNRKGYTFDGCIHWLVGTKKGSQFNRLWNELCNMDEMTFFDREIFMSIEGEGDNKIDIYTDLDRLEEHLLEKAPEDKLYIKKITEAAKVLSKLEYPLEKPEELYKFWDMPLMLFKMVPMLRIMGQFSRTSIREYLDQLTNPFLKEALGTIMPTGYAMIGLISTLASLHIKDAGFPKGGSLEFAKAIEKQYLGLGGKLNYNAKVTEIIVDDNRAAGLSFRDGTKVFGDLVISAADMHNTVYELLKGRYSTEKINESFTHLPLYSSSQVSLGLNCDLAGEPEGIALKLKQPITLGNEHNRYIYLTNYSFDPTLAPEGKTVLTATLYSSYEHWQPAAEESKERYHEKKDLLADRVIEIVENRFPAVKDKIETVDVATPVTYYRYTGVYKGAYMSWIVPPEVGRFSISKELPGLDNFYQVGQWVAPPAGLPGSMLTGRQVVQIICSRDEKTFTTA